MLAIIIVTIIVIKPDLPCKRNQCY